MEVLPTYKCVEKIIGNATAHAKFDKFALLDVNYLRKYFGKLKPYTNIETGITTTNLVDAFKVVGDSFLTILFII